MLFNSIDFAIFLPIVFLLYWFVFDKNLKLQNLFILVVSYIFYGWWDWTFLLLIGFSTLVDYLVGLSINRGRWNRKFLLIFSIFVNLVLLGVFKYYNFFVSNFVRAFSFFGGEINIGLLNIVLPVGISFYTFQTMSYTVDVYRKKLEPTKDFIAFAAFVSFFPQLVAGPIERATNLLPQFYKKRKFDYDKAVDGMRQILWGVFKKIVIADNCAEFVNQIFANSADMNGSTLVLGAMLFTFQLYGDFSGYSDIAIGIARLFGFNLMQNFAFPYFSRNFAEFWRRWHISLMSWINDYLLNPLMVRGNFSKRALVRSTFIVFLVSGLWHGANWTFIIWGLLNAVYLLPELLSKSRVKISRVIAQGKLLPTFKEFISVVYVFSLGTFALIFFRAENVSHAFHYVSGIFSRSLFEVPQFADRKHAFVTILLIIIFMTIEWFGRERQFAIQKTLINSRSIYRWLFYSLIIFLIGVFMKTKEAPFIYFQF